jgi:signal transduction histidine kinase
MVSPKKVLFVDDDRYFLKTVETLLSNTFDINTVSTVHNACNRLSSEQYDAIVLDHLLGEESGIELLERTSQDLTTPIIVLTGHPSETMMKEYKIHNNVKKFLIKPVDCNELEVQLHQVTSNLKWNDINKLMAQLNHSRISSDLYRSILHDISNMVGVMNGTVRLLQYDHERYRNRLINLESALQRVSRLIINAKRIHCSGEDKVQTFELGNYIKGIVDIYAEMISPSINLMCMFDTDRIYVTMSRLLLEIVLNNLIQNSIQAMDEGTILIKLSITHHGMIRILVKDNGYGIPREIREKLFEELITTKEEGMGIGLFTSRKLMAQMKLQLNLVSTSNEGTEFELIFPASIRVPG